jgi:uncharacterized protein YuzE
MKFNYYVETDSLYIELSDQPSADSREVAPNVVLDFDAEGRLVGIDLDQASKFVNLSQLEAKSLPIQAFALE